MARLPKFSSGQSLIEILTATGLLAVLLPAIITALVTSRAGRAQLAQRSEATELVREASESLRVIRQQDWNNIAPTGTYHPEIQSGNNWALASGVETISNFTRSVAISDVNRDPGTGNIVATGGIPDPSTKKIDISVTWGTPLPSSVATTMYFTRYLDNLSYTETTEAQFTAPGAITVGTTVTNTAGGEVTLGGGGHGDWCSPDLTLVQVDLPKSGVANALTAIPATDNPPSSGYAFAVTGDNASGPSFAKVDITDTDPPQAQSPPSNWYDPGGNLKTNDVFGEAGYGYLATDTNSKEIAIINLTSSPYIEAGWIDAPGNGDGNAVYVLGNTLFMASGDKFYAYNLSANRSGDQGSPVGTITLAGTGNRIKIVGQYAYVAVNSSATQMQIIDIQNPSALSQSSIIGQAVNLNNQGATNVFVTEDGNRAYLVTSVSTTSPELFILDISTKTGNRPALASRELGGMSPKGVVAVTNNKLIVVGTGGIEYQVYDVAGDVISTCISGSGLLEVDTGINGIASVIQPSGGAYSYIITGDANNEFKIIEGGPSGMAGTSGTFESAPFDFLAHGYSQFTAVNRYSATTSLPYGTSITYQFAGADPGPGSCADATYIYMDPNPDATVPLDDDGGGYENPAQCFRYKAIFSSPSSSSAPTLYDITINFSP